MGAGNRAYHIFAKPMIFSPGTPDPLGQQAGSVAGAMSLLIGVAANRSIVERKPVVIRELLSE